jgi:hypothetical protein
VFTSMAEVLGGAIDRRLHGEHWRQYQAASVQTTLHTAGMGCRSGRKDRRLRLCHRPRRRSQDRRDRELTQAPVNPAYRAPVAGTDLRPTLEP